jgi:Family of unknown function (DUF6370)
LNIRAARHDLNIRAARHDLNIRAARHDLNIRAARHDSSIVRHGLPFREHSSKPSLSRWVYGASSVAVRRLLGFLARFVTNWRRIGRFDQPSSPLPAARTRIHRLHRPAASIPLDFMPNLAYRTRSSVGITNNKIIDMQKALWIALSAASLLFVGSASTALAAGKIVTITGEGKCAKCSLHETDSCQNVIQAKEHGKTVTYYLTKNDVSNKFHHNICKGPKKVTAKGTIKDVHGKKEFTVTEIKTAE